MMKNTTNLLLLLITAMLGSTFASYAQSEDQKVELYVSMYKDDAIENQINFGVPAAITLAQALHESGIGSSYLAIYGNNHFGIKCGSKWTGPTIRKDDDKPNECFRRYENPKESYNDHSRFLVTNGRYSSLFRIDPTDYKAWAYGLKSAGYATNPQYATKLIEAIEKYGLNKYSIEAEGKTSLVVNNYEKNNKINQTTESNNTAEAVAVIPTTPTREVPIEEVLGGKLAPPTIRWDSIVRYKGLQAFYAPQGLSLVRASKEFQVPLSKLLLYNDLESDIIPEKSVMFLEAKRRRGVDEYAYAEKSMDMWQISQKNAIILSELCDLNRVSPGDYPLQGERIFLQKYNPARIKLDPSPFTTSSSDLPISVDGATNQKPDRSVSTTVNRVINFGSQPPPPRPIKEVTEDYKPYYESQEVVVPTNTNNDIENQAEVVIIDRNIEVEDIDNQEIVEDIEVQNTVSNIPETTSTNTVKTDPSSSWSEEDKPKTIHSVITKSNETEEEEYNSGDDDPEIVDFDQTIHLVTKGQNINMISVLYRVDKADIMKANNMSTEKIYEGQQIIIPSQNFKSEDTEVYEVEEVTEVVETPESPKPVTYPTNTKTPPASKNTATSNSNMYTVQNGDNLYQIAKRNGVTVEDIISINNKSDGFVFVGEKLIIPQPSSTSNIPNTRPIDQSVTELKHYVKKGETLFSISQQYGVTVNDVMSWNGLNSNNIYVGQALKILQ